MEHANKKEETQMKGPEYALLHKYRIERQVKIFVMHVV